MKFVVFGAGYVGLSLACLFARRHEVAVVDVDVARVEMLERGISPIRDEHIERALADEPSRPAATTDARSACAGADYAVIATPTNYDDVRNSFDTSSIESVVGELARMGSEAVVVIKSTVPVGYTEALQARYPALRLLFSPEFLREGRALYDNLHPSRIIVGAPMGMGVLADKGAPAGGAEPAGEGAGCAFAPAETGASGSTALAGRGAGRMAESSAVPHAARFAEELLACSEEDAGSVPLLFMGSTEAEAVKLFSNTYLALRVSFFNELDTYAEKRSLDTAAVIRGVCSDPRIGGGYNNPSFGYGGYCLPKDTKQLLANYEDVPQDLIRAIVTSNATRKHFVASRILAERPRRVGVYRLVMKEGSDNFRQSSVFDVIEELLACGVAVLVYEPLMPERGDTGSYAVTHRLGDLDACDVIIANRVSLELEPYREKVYTRDLWHTS